MAVGSSGAKMSKFSSFIRVPATEDHDVYFSDANPSGGVKAGAKTHGVHSIDDLASQKDGKEIVIAKVVCRSIIASANSDLLLGLSSNAH
jgi:hypothetical protein